MGDLWEASVDKAKKKMTGLHKISNIRKVRKLSKVCTACGGSGWVVRSWQVNQIGSSYDITSSFSPTANVVCSPLSMEVEGTLELVSCGCGAPSKHFICGAAGPDFAPGEHKATPAANVLEEIRSLSGIWEEGTEEEVLEKIHFLVSKRGLHRTPAFTGSVGTGDGGGDG